ncbi:hypothetical protein B0H13DRAFT_2329914 [Mycena leptocephala]|nr:hypothetical protein B0H13DRAFT_2329914 [Mycena leptocephala]
MFKGSLHHPHLHSADRQRNIMQPTPLRAADRWPDAVRYYYTHPLPEARRSQRKKKKKAAQSDDADDINKPAVSIAIYITIPKKSTVSASSKSRRSSNKSSDDEVLKKGPFKISSDDKYHAFITKLAATLPCRRENIHQQKISWKPLKPANAPSLPLSGEDGYAALSSSVYEKKQADPVVVLTMPPPAEPMEEDMPSAKSACAP